MKNTQHHILVVEDESSWQELFGETLRNMGYSVDQACDSLTGKQKLAQQDYDLVLLDVGLDQPGFNLICQQFCEEIRKRNPHLPLLAMSGKKLSPPEMATLFIDFKPVGFIDKSTIDIAKFRLQIQTIIGKGKNRIVPRPWVVKTEKSPLPARTHTSPTVVLLTVNEHETDAVFDVFLGERRTPSTTTRAGVTYNDLGYHGNMRIVHTICEMGAGSIGAAQQRTRSAISAWKPTAVIAVGIAFGMDELKQRIGDVLVAAQLQDYELGRLGNSGIITPRGDKPGTSDRWRNRLRIALAIKKRDDAKWPEVHFGLVLSGQKLVDNLDYRESLKSLYSGAIGGEMEGVGLYVSASEAKVDWIVVKGICDWGHDKNNPEKENWQKLAAQNAARVLKSGIDLGDLYSSHSIA